MSSRKIPTRNVAHKKRETHMLHDRMPRPNYMTEAAVGLSKHQQAASHVLLIVNHEKKPKTRYIPLYFGRY